MAGSNQRKLANRRFNEQAKLLATFLNSLSIATFGAAFVVPLAQGQYDASRESHWLLLPAGVALHIGAQAALRLIRSED